MILRPCFARAARRSLLNRAPSLLLVNPQRVQCSSTVRGARTIILKPTHSETSAITQQLKTTRQTFEQVIKRQNAENLIDCIFTIRRVFFSLPRSHWSIASSSPAYLKLERYREVETVVKVLTKRVKTENADTLNQFLRDLKTVYGVEPDRFLLSTLFDYQIRAGQIKEAHDTLYFFWNRKASIRPDSSHWGAVMHALSQQGEIAKVRTCIDDMKKSWPFPRNTHYECLVESMINSEQPLSIEEVYDLIEEMARLNLPYSNSIYSKLSDLYTKKGSMRTAEDFAQMYNTRFASRPVPSGAQTQAWLSSLLEQRSRSKAAFEGRLRSSRLQGFVPSSRILSQFLKAKSVTSVGEINYLQEVLEVEANIVCWSIVLRNALTKLGQSKADGWRSAKAIYDAARGQGIIPDSAMVDPLLRAMCGGQISGISEEALDEAVLLYDDFASSSCPSAKPDAAIFNTLLRALASSLNKAKHFPVAMRILEEMRKLEISMDPMTATSIAVLLIRSCTSFDEAGETYRRIRDLNGEILDRKGFTAVLHAFCSLDIELSDNEMANGDGNDDDYLDRVVPKHRSIPPASTYFEIVKDMHMRGFQKSSEVYTILLGRYAALSTRAQCISSLRTRHALLSTLRDVISETHHRLTLDASLDLDPPLLNQLMDAYNRVGDFGGVLTVWALLVAGGKVTPASVSVIFDACGFAGAHEAAEQVFKEIKEMGVKLNKRNWNAWIECLGRLGRLEEAFDVVSLDMCKGELSDRPDEESIKLLMSFAAKAGKVEDMELKLNQRFPGLLDVNLDSRNNS